MVVFLLVIEKLNLLLRSIILKLKTAKYELNEYVKTLRAQYKVAESARTNKRINLPSS